MTGALTSPQESPVCPLQKNPKHYGRFVTIKTWLNTRDASQIPQRSIREIQLPSTVQLLSIRAPQNMKSASSLAGKRARHQARPEQNQTWVVSTFLPLQPAAAAHLSRIGLFGAGAAAMETTSSKWRLSPGLLTYSLKHPSFSPPPPHADIFIFILASGAIFFPPPDETNQ